MILGPVPCQGCRQPVVWRSKRWRNTGQRRGRHVCGAGAKCGAFMPQAGDRCGRGFGHNGGHRSPYAMENERVAKTGRRAA